MKISILTLFPEMFQGPFQHSILKHAQDKQLVKIDLINIRDFGIGAHKQVDDSPYGGGIGMVMRVDVLHNAIKHSIKDDTEETKRKIVLTSAKGGEYTQTRAITYSQLDHLVIICGHYEGVDERILRYVDEEISIGKYVLTGGEIPAMVLTDSITRLIHGVLKPEATRHESFSLQDQASNELLEYPHYTRPPNYEGVQVPEVLIQGNHKLIDKWRFDQSKRRQVSRS